MEVDHQMWETMLSACGTLESYKLITAELFQSNITMGKHRVFDLFTRDICIKMKPATSYKIIQHYFHIKMSSKYDVTNLHYKTIFRLKNLWLPIMIGFFIASISITVN